MKPLALLLILTLTACGTSPYVAPTSMQWGQISSGAGQAIKSERVR